MKYFTFFVFIFLFCVGNIYSEIIKVPSEQPTIQDGINAASDSDTVLVDPGTWVQSINFNGKNIVVGSLFLTTGETSYISGTVIDGNQNGTVVTFENGEDSTTLLCGFTLQNGSAEMGGGIFCDDVSPRLKNLIIRNNSGNTDGGGMTFLGSSVSIEDVTVEENTALVGAGIYCAESNLFMLNVNVNTNVSVYDGGGLQIHRSNLIVDSCVFEYNQAENGYGGGLNYLNDEGDNQTFEINISNTDFIGNSSLVSIGGMGVIKYDEDSSIINVIIDKCEFRDNTSDNYTGLRITGEFINCILSNSSFVGNEAERFTGGVGYTGQSSGEVINCYFAFNEAALGGGDWNSGGAGVWSDAEVDFTNCTFIDNRATYGSGLTVGNGGISTATNCIFWGNTVDQIALAPWDNVGGTLTVNYCDVEGGLDDVNNVDDLSTLIWGEKNIDRDPLFADWQIEDFHLTDHSLCIGSGTPTGAPTTDIEGSPRPNPPESNPDMGAYENSLGLPLQESNIFVSEDSLDFGLAYLGFSDTLELEVSNFGTVDLLIMSITTDLPEYSVSPNTAVISAHESETLVITFSPQIVGYISGTLFIISNDPDTDTLTVALEGQGVEPPDISVSPDSLSEDLLTGQTSIQTITIENTGLGNLDFDISLSNQHHALQFDGIDDYVELPRVSFNDLPSGSVEFWVNVDILDREILYKETYNAETISGMRTNFDGTIEGSHNNFWGSDDVVSSTTLSTNEWYHIVWTWNGEIQEIYINGELDNTQPSTDGVADDLGAWVRWGRGDTYFKGIIDEIRIWNTVRTQYEIQLDMYREISGSEQGLIGYWNFNEGSGDTTFDHTSGNNHGMLSGEITWIQSSAPVNSWLSVDMTSGSIPSGSSSDITITFDATGLIGGDYSSHIIISSNDPDEPQVIIPADLHITGIPDISLSDTTMDFEETYIGFPKTDTLVVSNIGTDLLTISNISSDNSFFTVDTTSFNLNIRENQQVSITFTPDTIGLYSGLLTINSSDPDESIRIISLLGQGFVAPEISVSPDSIGVECSIGDTIDHSFMIYNWGGAELNFNILIDYSSVAGSGSYALQFDGMNDFVRVYEHDIFDLTTDMTIEAWINAFTTDGPRVIVSKWNDYGPDFSYIFKIWNASDKLSIELSENNDFGDLADLEGITSVSINEWIHVAVTYNSNEVKLFYNGVEDNSTAASGIIRNSIVDLIIGANSNGAFMIENFYGLIDEVRIWDMARAQSEIQADMYREISGDETGLIGYWPFNEGSGNTAFDQTINGNNGILQNGITWIKSTAPLSPSWFSVDPKSGTILPGDSLDIKSKFDARGLSEEYNKANMIISSNDPVNSEIRIPVQLRADLSGLEDLFENNIPKTYILRQSFPNPFNPITHIRYELPEATNVKIEVYNILGQKITTLVNTRKPAGYYMVEFDGSEFASGIYIYRIEAGEFQDVKKMVLIR